MAEKLPNAERRKRFSKEIARLERTLSPEEREDRQGQSFVKKFFLDAPKDVIGTKMDREGGDISPEARAKEIFDASRKRRAKEKKDAQRTAKNRARAKANPSLLKGGVNYKKGGKVRGAGIARKGVRPAKMR